ncbi:MAG: thiol:disulfide interchange protein [Burkholderiales bacterium 66-5]|uniref:DsbE family thiol:disulfide interchange protein n=1 Tax=Comamonas badia TaxID=265291 RepID=UPI0004678EE2|nr:DsbE family thiol:disulfide interchange protein [Comamonas badia]OJU89892.1 MAG: thiol:disulfide interchange protein [Burkholderiales bacterium 66-5]
MRKGVVPLAVFLVLVAFLGIGLTLNPRELPSPLVDKPLPQFSLPQLSEPQKAFAPADMKGKVWMLNVWASWCVACRVEHPVLVELSKTDKSVLIYGLNYKDRREDALQWLTRFGNPYAESISDTQGLVGIDLGVYGVPETFIIDKQGVIRHKQIGPITPEVLQDTILPLMRKLGA